MKKLFTITILVSTFCFSQTFTGRVTNHFSQGLSGKRVEIYFDQGYGQQLFIDITDVNGYFLADSLSTNVKFDNLLPDEYSVSLNYPNPFNPKTIFNLSLKQTSNISVDVFDIIGQKIFSIDRKEYPAGNQKLVIELNGFSNGVYIARINIDEKYFVTRKMLLLYGSQHANELSYSFPIINKITTTNIDSVVITGDAIKRTTFTGFPTYTTNNIDIGTLQVDSNYVNLTLNVKKLMEWKQTNNQLTNALVNLSGQEKTTDANGQASFRTPSGRNTLIITHPEIYKREAILQLEKDSTHTEYILDTLNYPQSHMDFYDDIFGRSFPLWGYKSSRWTEPPIFYIVADTTTEPGRWRALQQIAKIDTVLKPAYTTPTYPEGFLKNYQVEIGLNPPQLDTPGYYVIDWGDIAPVLGWTYVLTDTTTGRILYGETTYNELLDPYGMERVSIHELATVLSAAGRSNELPSVWNLPIPSWDERNFTESDLKMILYQYTRPPGNKIIDKDNDF